MKALVGAFNQEKALVGAFSVIVQLVVEPMDRFTALVLNHGDPDPGHHGHRVGGGEAGREVAQHAALYQRHSVLLALGAHDQNQPQCLETEVVIVMLTVKYWFQNVVI